MLSCYHVIMLSCYHVIMLSCYVEASVMDKSDMNGKVTILVKQSSYMLLIWDYPRVTFFERWLYYKDGSITKVTVTCSVTVHLF